MPASDAQPTPKVKSEAIKFDIASPTGIVYNHITRNAAGNANVGLRYDTSKAPEAIKQGIVGPQIQKVLIQTALFRKATVRAGRCSSVLVGTTTRAQRCTPLWNG